MVQAGPRIADTGGAAHDRLYRMLRQQIMHGEIAPGQAMTLRGIGPGERAVDDAGARGLAAAGGGRRADAVGVGKGFDAGTVERADRGTGDDAGADRAGTGVARVAQGAFRADRAVAGDQRGERRGGRAAGCGGLHPDEPGVSPDAVSSRAVARDAGDDRDDLAAAGSDDAGGLFAAAPDRGARRRTG